jgi:hypothetical protein
MGGQTIRAATLPLPTQAGYEIVVIAQDGAIHQLHSGDLYSPDEIAQAGTDMIERVLTEADDYLREDYRRSFVERLRGALPTVDVAWIEFWWKSWPVLRWQHPRLDYAHPLESKLVWRVPGEYFYRSSPQESAIFLQFGDSLGLLDHQLMTESEPVSACESLYVLSGWRALETPSQDYQITLVLVGLDGMGIAQDDGPLAISSTSTWQPGEEYLDRRSISLPCDLAPGLYRLMLGLYDLDTVQNLWIRYPGGPDFTTLAILAEIYVEAAESGSS